MARAYSDFCDVLVIDRQDQAMAERVANTGVRPVVANTIMNTLEDRINLAQTILDLE